MQPTTSLSVQSANLEIRVPGPRASRMQLSQPRTESRCETGVVPRGASAHPTQLPSEFTALSFSTDSLPKLIVTLRMKRAVSQLRCL